MNDMELPGPVVDFPFDISLTASNLFRRALQLSHGPGADRRAAARLLYGVSFFYSEPARPLWFLAQLYFEGTGELEEHLPARLQLLRWGASLGDGECTHSLAVAYQYGQGTAVDLATAGRLFRMIWERLIPAGPETTADSGLDLADVLLEATPVTQPVVSEVIGIYEGLLQDEFGGVRSTLALGRLLRGELRGGEEDRARARDVYSGGLALNDNGDVLFELAGMLESGEGGHVNLVGAYAYYQMADDHGVEGAAERMEDLYARMMSD